MTRHPILPRLAGAAVLLALALGALPPAEAHAALLYSSPPKDMRLDAAPPRVSATFTEDVEAVGTRLVVRDSADRQVDLRDSVLDGGRVVSVGLPAELRPGPYRVEWDALSAYDNHPTHGVFGFAVGDFEPPAAGRDESVPVQSALARAITYSGFALAFGAAAFLLWMRKVGYPPGVARLALAAGATLHLSGTVLQAASLSSQTGIPFHGLASFDAGVWRLFALGLGALAWFLAVVQAVRPVAAGPAIATTLLLGAAVASARLGHPFGKNLMVVDFVHLVSAATWAGGLLLLLWFAHRAGRDGTPPETLRAVGIRFGTLALACVILLAGTGVVLTVGVLGPDVLGDPGRLFSAPYAYFLLGKVALAVAMVAIAAVNRYVLLEGAADAGLAGGLQRAARKVSGGRIGPGLVMERFGRTVAVEASLGVVVLVLAGLLTAVPPPGGLEPAEAPIVLEAEGRFHNVTLSIAPPRVGQPSALHFRITQFDPVPAPVANSTCGRSEGSCVQVTVTYGGATAGEERDAQSGGGIWMVMEGVWAQAGPARITIRIATQEHFEDTVEFRVDVRA